MLDESKVDKYLARIVRKAARLIKHEKRALKKAGKIPPESVTP